jgi:hypothetical protein
MRRAPRSRLSLRFRLSLQRGKCQAGRPALSSQKPRSERFRARSDETHVPPQNTISTVLIIKTGHFSPLATGGKLRTRAGDGSRTRAQRGWSHPEHPSCFMLIVLRSLCSSTLCSGVTSCSGVHHEPLCLAGFLRQRQDIA